MVRVLIVDDSALVRQMLTTILRRDPQIQVVGAVSDPYAAWDAIKQFEPDLITLDVEMPKMDGLTFLEKLMAARPMPVLMVSSLTEQGAKTTLRALELGAIDFIAKPCLDISTGLGHLASEIIEKVKQTAQARVRRPGRSPQAERPAKRKSPGAILESTDKVIAIGASTGGTEALCEVLSALPADGPGVVVVQHMPANFTKAFAKRLDGICAVRVKEAESGDRVLRGHVLLAPGNYHMEVVRSGAIYSVRLNQGPPVNQFRPSVDVLFYSCAKHLGPHCTAAILTGMGKDGAHGMLALKNVGARTIAQNEQTCVVFGMPREAIALGAAQKIVPLQQISVELLSFHSCLVSV
jgi:two-component system, chemotaxis family, protein-glutamate methylesterase/glutaminase